MQRQITKPAVPKIINGQVNFDDARLCGNYFSFQTCLLATALRRLYPKAKEIEVYQRMFQIDGEFYEFSRGLNTRIYDAYQAIRDNTTGDFQPFDFTADLIN